MVVVNLLAILAAIFLFGMLFYRAKAEAHNKNRSKVGIMVSFTALMVLPIVRKGSNAKEAYYIRKSNQALAGFWILFFTIILIGALMEVL